MPRKAKVAVAEAPMTPEQFRAERARQEAAWRKQEEAFAAEGERQVLEIVARYGLDLAKIARKTRIYRNPADPWSDPWMGTGRQPKWLSEALKAGRRLEEFEARADDGQHDPDSPSG